MADYVAKQPKPKGAAQEGIGRRGKRGSHSDPHSASAEPLRLEDYGIPKGKVAQEYRRLAAVPEADQLRKCPATKLIITLYSLDALHALQSVLYRPCKPMISEATNQLRQLGSARQLAKRLNVSRATLAMWFRGLRSPGAAARALMFERLQIPTDAWDRPADGLVPITRSRAEGRAAAKAERVEAANAGVTIAIRPHPEGGFTVQIGPHVYRALHANRADVKRTAQRVAARDHRPHECDERHEVPIGASRPGVWGSEYAIDRRGHV